MIQNLYMTCLKLELFFVTRWMDGAFMDLDAEQVEAEVDEYTRDIYKVQKVFNSRLKKIQLEVDDRNRERKKRRRHAEENGQEVAPEDQDEVLVPPQGMEICTKVQDSMRDFKVNGNILFSLLRGNL